MPRSDALLARAHLLRWTPCLERLADVDVLLDELEENPGYIHWSVQALLTAAGRFDAASRTLRVLGPLAQSDRRRRSGVQQSKRASGEC